MQIESSGILLKEFQKFTLEQRILMYNNLVGLQLTDGCSVGCDFCCLDAKFGVSDVISFDMAGELISEIRSTERLKISNGVSYSFLSLYNASDPLDYINGAKDYFDVLELFEDEKHRILTVTAIPKGKEELAVRNLDKINGISISHMNRKRLIPYFEKLKISIYLDLENFQIPNFNFVKYKGSIQDSLPRSLTYREDLPSQASFSEDLTNLKPSDRKDLALLFCADQENPYSQRVVDKDHMNFSRIGRAYNRERFSSDIYGFMFSGVVITPKGFFNVLSVLPSEKNKSGKIIEKINPSDFKVAKLNPCKSRDPKNYSDLQIYI